MSMAVSRARWPRRHPALSVLASLALLAGLTSAGVWSYPLAFPPALTCGAGMTAAGSPAACVGVNLDGTPFTAHDPARMRTLEAQVARIDSDVRGPYSSILLLLDLSPAANVDTITYSALYPNIEGAITAVWRANNTAALGGGRDVKLYLGNMGSRYGSWRQAIGQITANAAAQRISSVIGLGQSTAQTRSAAALLSSEAHLPVIGSTVTGDSMNTNPATGRQIPDFFRVSPPNSVTVAGAAQYISGLRPRPATIVIVADTVRGDDYTSTLYQQARRLLPAPGRTVKVLTYISPASVPPGVTRQRDLDQQFNLLDNRLCEDDPSLVYFAGRGYDLPLFVNSWVQGAACSSVPRLNLVSGDDASSSIGYSVITNAIAARKMTLAYTSLASPDMWGTACPGSAAKANYDQFWAAFTGNMVPCTRYRLQQNDNATPLNFDPADLDSGQAILTHDAAITAIAAIRDDSLVLADPESQTGVIHQFACTQALPGAGGWIAFASDGNPTGRPVPVVRVNANGTVTTAALTWPGSAPFLSRPTTGQAAFVHC